jgi:hypothetical protein
VSSEQWQIDADGIADELNSGDVDEAVRYLKSSVPWLFDQHRIEMLDRIRRRTTNKDAHTAFMGKLLNKDEEP